MTDAQMNLGFWDIMSRYRKHRNRIPEYQRLDSEPVKAQRRIPRILFIAVGVVVSLAIAFVLLSQATETKNTDVVIKSTQIPWYERKTSWPPKYFSSSVLKQICREVDYERLNQTMQPMLIPRTPGSRNHSMVAHHILVELQKLGFTLQVDRFFDNPPNPYPKTQFTNLIATWDQYATRKLVLACHYDSKVEPEGFIGATDSAAPCAMIIEIATALRPFLPTPSSNNEQINDGLTLELIFFDGEEAYKEWTATDSLYGSRHLANLWHTTKVDGVRTKLHQIDLMILLDLIGTPTTTFRNFLATETPWYKRASEIEHRLKSLKLLKSWQTRFPTQEIDKRHVVEDDHIPFQRKGVPILHLISVPFPTEWHTLRDNGSILDQNTIDDITKVIAATVAQYLHLHVT
uniref:Glutaminyl-peptide cyclotransferase n=1 Tax=Phallusia mammillata TaxID=59560 RepID=A0A6F9DQS6_9ASCI|nr:glutaminyl-peptide cyclotransferase [Phallusia mammillata]